MKKSRNGRGNKITLLLVLLGAILVFFIDRLIVAPVDYNEVQVVRVIDGDTFVGEDHEGEEIRVRLIGVNAPETRARDGREADAFGQESKKFLEGMIHGEVVKLATDITERDRFGRRLAYVYLHNGTFVNAELVEHGYAQASTHPPNVRYSDTFYSLEREAREANRGLWQYQ